MTNLSNNCDSGSDTYEQCSISYLYCLHGTCNAGGICECRKGWIGDSCDICCDESQCIGGECMTFFNTTLGKEVAFCNCYKGFSGEYCTNSIVAYIPDPDPIWKLWVTLAVVAMVMTMVALTTILVLYYLYLKGRLPSWMQRIVWYFKAWEDDDGLENDGVVSYADADVGFVKNTLYPGLQALKFKTWLMDKDSVPGSVMQQEIINAVQNSRRTILLISSNYIDEEWPSLYHQVAFFEMLKKNKHRIITIILQDISEVDDVDPDLRYIMETLPILKWPQGPPAETAHKVKKFWKKLELHMPKIKRPTTNQLAEVTWNYQVPDEVVLRHDLI